MLYKCHHFYCYTLSTWNVMGFCSLPPSIPISHVLSSYSSFMAQHRGHLLGEALPDGPYS